MPFKNRGKYFIWFLTSDAYFWYYHLDATSSLYWSFCKSILEFLNLKLYEDNKIVICWERWNPHWVTRILCIFLHGFIQFSRSVMSDSLWPHESQHARPPCPSPTPRVDPNSCASSRWCHPAISSSVVPFSSCPHSLPASGSFPMSQLFAWGGQGTGVSALASFLPKNTQDWSPLGWTGWISLQSKGLSRVFSNTTGQKHQFFGAQLSSQSKSHIHTWPLEKP